MNVKRVWNRILRYLAEKLIENHQTKCLQILLERGLDPNLESIRFDNTSLLMEAVYCRSPEIVKLLIKYGADVNKTDNGGWNALTVAIANYRRRNDDLQTIEYLCQAGADLSYLPSKFHHPLTQAIYGRYEEVIALLLDYGADPIDWRDGSCPLLDACFDSDEFAGPSSYIITQLAQRAANINKPDEQGNTVLHRLAQLNAFEHGRNLNILFILLENGADPNTFNSAGHTPLMLTCSKPNTLEAVDLMVEFGGNPFLENSRGESAITMYEQHSILDLKDILKWHKRVNKIQKETGLKQAL